MCTLKPLQIWSLRAVLCSHNVLNKCLSVLSGKELYLTCLCQNKRGDVCVTSWEAVNNGYEHKCELRTVWIMCKVVLNANFKYIYHVVQIC